MCTMLWYQRAFFGTVELDHFSVCRNTWSWEATMPKIVYVCVDDSLVKIKEVCPSLSLYFNRPLNQIWFSIKIKVGNMKGKLNAFSMLSSNSIVVILICQFYFDWNIIYWYNYTQQFGLIRLIQFNSFYSILYSPKSHTCDIRCPETLTLAQKIHKCSTLYPKSTLY